MEYVYIVKGLGEDTEGFQVDPIRFVTLDVEKAHDYVNSRKDEFLWIDGYELDGTGFGHIL